MRKEYLKPMLVCEKFAADEYVSACWYGECNISGHVYLDSNGNKQYDPGIDQYSYRNSACKEQFSITGVNNGYNDASDLINAFVVGEHYEWVRDDDSWFGGHFEIVEETVPVYNYDKYHVSRIDSVRKAEDRPNHS